MSIYKKLFEAKKEIGKISKDAKNPFFKSNYLSLNGLIDAVETVLEKHDLLLLQPIKNGAVLTTIVDVENYDKNVDCEDSMVHSEMQLPNITDPQKLGSAITYYRRYTLQSLLGLQAEDDDGNKASKPTPINVDRLKTKLEACKDLQQLQTVYLGFTKPEQTATVKIKNDMKLKLTK